jgi:outer membrane biogenesis lipoprotein LolB
VAELRQEGWLIQYESFAEASPERIHLSRPDLDLRLVIESFSSGTP